MTLCNLVHAKLVCMIDCRHFAKKTEGKNHQLDFCKLYSYVGTCIHFVWTKKKRFNLHFTNIIRLIATLPTLKQASTRTT